MEKTYIAKGLLEFQMVIPVGGAKIRICFSGGSMGSNGVLPARYTTDNPVIQKIIDNSEQMHTGRIACLTPEKEEEEEDKKV